MTTLIHPSQVLSGESMEKVSLIADINKLSKMIDGSILTTEEFDELYDLDVEDLIVLIDSGERIVRAKQALRNLANAVFRIQERANDHRKNNEEGD